MDTCEKVLRNEAEKQFRRWMRGEIHAVDCEMILHGFFEADREHMLARLQNTAESPENSPASPVQHAQAEISLAVDRYDAVSEFDFLAWVRSRLPKWRKLSAMR